MAFYAAETWTLSNTHIESFESFKMWLWRKVEMISWTAKASNSEVLERAVEVRCIISTIRQCKHRLLGHVL